MDKFILSVSIMENFKKNFYLWYDNAISWELSEQPT